MWNWNHWRGTCKRGVYKTCWYWCFWKDYREGQGEEYLLWNRWATINIKLNKITCFTVFLWRPDTYPDKFKDRFDVVTWASAITVGHCTPEIFDEILLSLKTDGLLIFSTRADFIAEVCQGRMNELSELGKWELVSKEDFVRYPDTGEGVGRFKPTPNHLFVQEFSLKNLNSSYIIIEKS